MSREIWKEIIELAKLYPPHAQGEFLNRLDELYTVSKKGEPIEVRKHKFAESLGLYSHLYKREMIVDFFRYWSEHSENGRRMRYEKEKVFNVKLRLERWYKNSKQNNAIRKGQPNTASAINEADRVIADYLNSGGNTGG